MENAGMPRRSGQGCNGVHMCPTHGAEVEGRGAAGSAFLQRFGGSVGGKSLGCSRRQGRLDRLLTGDSGRCFL